MRPATLLLAALLLCASPASADRFVSGQAADVVLGQPDFTTSTIAPNSPSRFANPSAAAMDPTTGKIFVADRVNNRILRFSSAAASQNGSNPEAVIGQPNFTSTQSNQGGAPTANTLSGAGQITVDSQGRLWVADSSNHRVLGYFAASLLGNNPSADYVFGQPNFLSNGPGTTAATMVFPQGVAVGPDDTLWVADSGNSRILRFGSLSTKASSAAADGVLGQIDFLSNLAGTSATTLTGPSALSVDAVGRVWVADTGNNRVLRFDNASTVADANGAPANGVLGQPDFVSFGNATTATGMSVPQGVHAAPDGTLWVAENFNNRIIGFPSASGLPTGGAASVVLGAANFTAVTSGTSAQLVSLPLNVSGGPGQSLLVADLANQRVLRFSPVKSPTLTVKTRIRSTRNGILPVRGSTTGQVTKVTFRVGSRGKFKSVLGTAVWGFNAALKPGKNRISIVAEGPGGISRTATLVVTRRP